MNIISFRFRISIPAFITCRVIPLVFHWHYKVSVWCKIIVLMSPCVCIRGVAQWSDMLVFLLFLNTQIVRSWLPTPASSAPICHIVIAKNILKKKSLCTMYKHISCTLEIMIKRTFLCRFERWPYLDNSYSLNVFSTFEHYIIC